MSAYEMGDECVATTSRSASRLAREARKLIAGSADRMDAVELLGHIDELTEEWRSTPTAPMYAWLTNLRREVEQA